jgi:hypothetical protein
MNTTFISGSILKICRKFGIGVGQKISTHPPLLRLWRKDIPGVSYFPDA